MRESGWLVVVAFVLLSKSPPPTYSCTLAMSTCRCSDDRCCCCTNSITLHIEWNLVLLLLPFVMALLLGDRVSMTHVTFFLFFLLYTSNVIYWWIFHYIYILFILIFSPDTGVCVCRNKRAWMGVDSMQIQCYTYTLVQIECRSIYILGRTFDSWMRERETPLLQLLLLCHPTVILSVQFYLFLPG